jgi:hypothetical protein
MISLLNISTVSKQGTCEPPGIVSNLELGIKLEMTSEEDNKIRVCIVLMLLFQHLYG